MAGFGDGTSNLYMRAMTIPGGGRLELGEITDSGDGTGTLLIPTTLTRLMYGHAWADGTQFAIADLTNPTTVITNSFVEFTCTITDASHAQTWFFMMFGY